MARAIDSEAAYRFLSEQLVKETGAFSKGVNKGLNIARSAMRNPDAIPTLTPPNEWVSRVQELDELYTKLQIVTGFTAEQLLEMFAAGYTLKKPDYSKHFEAMANLAESDPPNEPLTLEQLREMDGEPVWVVVSQNWRESGIKSGWRLVKFHINDDRIRLYMFDTHFGASFFAEQDMGRSYWVYHRPPEGEEAGNG